MFWRPTNLKGAIEERGCAFRGKLLAAETFNHRCHLDVRHTRARGAAISPLEQHPHRPKTGSNYLCCRCRRHRGLNRPNELHMQEKIADATAVEDTRRKAEPADVERQPAAQRRPAPKWNSVDVERRSVGHARARSTAVIRQKKLKTVAVANAVACSCNTRPLDSHTTRSKAEFRYG